MPYPATQTFWLDNTDEVAVGLRRYTHGDGGFDCDHGHHHALVYTGTEPAAYEQRGDRTVRTNGLDEVDHGDPRWPHTCAQLCGYEFTDGDQWQRWTELLYRRTDTGQLRVLHQGAPAPDAPSAEPGATWDAWWMPFSRGPDDICLVVRCPNGRDWMVDSQASNCTRKGEPHQCWVRHGDPRECRLTVDKNSDNTCAAGAGSIQAGDYHGFLQNGILTAG